MVIPICVLLFSLSPPLSPSRCTLNHRIISTNIPGWLDPQRIEFIGVAPGTVELVGVGLRRYLLEAPGISEWTSSRNSISCRRWLALLAPIKES
jgi:hypothetical protein